VTFQLVTPYTFGYGGAADPRSNHNHAVSRDLAFLQFSRSHVVCPCPLCIATGWPETPRINIQDVRAVGKMGRRYHPSRGGLTGSGEVRYSEVTEVGPDAPVVGGEDGGATHIYTRRDSTGLSFV